MIDMREQWSVLSCFKAAVLVGTVLIPAEACLLALRCAQPSLRNAAVRSDADEKSPRGRPEVRQCHAKGFIVCQPKLLGPDRSCATGFASQ